MHAVVDRDFDRRLAPLGHDAHTVAVGHAETDGVDGGDSQSVLPRTLAPRGVAEDGVGGERAALSGGQQERPFVGRTGRDAQAVEFGEEFCHVEVHEPVGPDSDLDAAVALAPDARRLVSGRLGSFGVLAGARVRVWVGVGGVDHGHELGLPGEV